MQRNGNISPYHLRKPRVLSPLRSLRVRNEVDLVPLVCEDVSIQAIMVEKIANSVQSTCKGNKGIANSITLYDHVQDRGPVLDYMLLAQTKRRGDRVRGERDPHTHMYLTVFLRLFLMLLAKVSLWSAIVEFSDCCHLGLDATKPVFGASDKARLKPVSSVTITS